jgi:hypothetical protein
VQGFTLCQNYEAAEGKQAECKNCSQAKDLHPEFGEWA